ncbi:MAG: hypothetical protein WBV82_29010 [Myxococcaceae bacterium]
MGRHGITCLAVFWAALASAEAPCPHPYFPMEEGLTLKYRAGKSEVTVTFSDVRREGTSLRASLHMNHGGKNGVTEASCTPEGVVTTGGLEGAALSMSGLTVNVIETHGVAMLPPSQMVEGATWSNTMTIELRPPDTVKLPFGPVRTTFKKDAVVEGRKQIEIAGKTWQALRIRNTTTVLAGADGERTMESTLWLAPGVGILRIQTGETVDLELLDVSYPNKPPPAKPASPRRSSDKKPGQGSGRGRNAQ